MKPCKYMNTNRWAVYIPNFSPDKAKVIRTIAREKRMSAGAYIGSLLDREIENSTAKAGAPYSQGGIRNGHPDQAG